MEVLKILADKLSQYNFLTNTLPGTVLCLLLKYLVGWDIIPSDYYQAGIIFYFAGMVCSRAGSIIIEPVLKKTKFIRFAPYPNFVTAEKKDEKLVVLSQENNVFRSYMSVAFISLIVYAFKYIPKFKVCTMNVDLKLILLLALFLLFLFSYRKQTKFVKKRVEQSVNSEEKNKNEE